MTGGRPGLEKTMSNLGKHRTLIAPRRCRTREAPQKVYAHTDNASGRWAEIGVTPPDAEDVVRVVWKEEWLPYPRENLPFAISLCERLARRLRNDAGAIQMKLDGLAEDV